MKIFKVDAEQGTFTVEGKSFDNFLEARIYCAQLSKGLKSKSQSQGGFEILTKNQEQTIDKIQS